jgi:hypothetical protein
LHAAEAKNGSGEEYLRTPGHRKTSLGTDRAH